MKYAAYTIATEIAEKHVWTEKVVVKCEETPIKTMLSMLTDREHPYVTDNNKLYDLLLVHMLSPFTEKTALSEYSMWLTGMKEVTETYMLYYGNDIAYEIEFIRHLTAEEVANYNTVQGYWERDNYQKAKQNG